MSMASLIAADTAQEESGMEGSGRLTVPSRNWDPGTVGSWGRRLSCLGLSGRWHSIRESTRGG